MSRARTKIGTFTARTTWGPMEVPITERMILFGLHGFAAHREITRHGFSKNFVISHVASGRKVPGDYGKTSREAMRKCLDMLNDMEVGRVELEEMILVLSKLDKERA